MTQGARPDIAIEVVPVTPFQQNCLIVFDRATLRGGVVDPGGDVDRIMAALARLGVKAEQIVLTHGHIDHAGGAAELAERLGGVPVVGPDRRDAFLLATLEADGTRFGMQARTVAPDGWLEEGDVLEIAGAAFAVLHCPGHTPGSLAFFDAAARLAIVGDVLFRGSVGRTDFGYGDPAALIGSITGKLLPLGDDVAFLCGHGPGSTIGRERRSNPFLRAQA